MDLSRVYTKTSKGILEGSTKSRDLTREHGRVLALIDGKSSVSDLLEKNSRLSESRLAAILDELAAFGMIRQLNGALAVDDLGFSSTIIVDESNTQAFFEAQAHLERELRRAEDHEVRAKEQDRAALLTEVKADIEAEAEAIKRELAERNAREVQAKADVAARREAEIQAQAAEKARQAREEAEAHAKAVAEHARKQLEAEAKARQEAEARAKALEAEVFARAEAARKAKLEAEQRAQAEADAKARMEAEKKAREQAEKQAQAAEKAREAAERKARKEAEENARLAKVAEEKANARHELEAKIQAEEEAQRRGEMEARMREMEQDKRRAEEEAQALAKALDEARIASELETRVKRRMEARAREEEETRLRVEAEARAKLEEESRLRQEAEARAREEAEARRLAEEAKIKAEQEAQTQLEAERLARKEAEARAIAEAEAQRQAEAVRLDAERRAEEERQAREAAEREARAIAEARAKAEEEAARREAEQRRIEEAAAQAGEQARLAAEQLAEETRKKREQDEREARAVAEAETAVRLEAEAVKRQMEEQQRAEEARLEREEMARQQEAARAAAEAAEAQSRALAEARERAEAEARARDEARQQAREAAEAAARAEAEEALQRLEEAARREETEEARLRAEAQTRAMAAAQGEAVFPFLTSRKRTRIRFDKTLIKPAAYGFLGLLLFVLVAVHLFSFNFYIPKLERQLTESLGQRIVVKDIRFSAYPAPHLKLEGVTIGDLADVRVGTVRLFPVFASWFSEEKVMHRVELESVTLSEDSVSALSIWSRNQTKAVPVQFERVLVKDAKLANRLLDLFAFDADVKMDHGRFTKAQIKSTDQRITIDFTPQADALAIQLTAIHSVLPLEPRIQFDELKITAVARQGAMTLSQIEGQLYGGSLSGSAQVEWRNGWIFSSDVGVRQVAIEPALALFTRNMKASGVLEAKIRLTTKSEALETLFAAPQVQATFRAREGEVAGVDLVRAIQSARSGGNIGGKTYFNELSGYLQIDNGHYRYWQLKLLTGVMSASGNLEFSTERNLSGSLVGELRTRATKLRTPFTLGGTLATPTLKAAKSAQRAAPVEAIQEDQ